MGDVNMRADLVGYCLIPDCRLNVSDYYSESDLAGCIQIGSDYITGEVTVRLKDGRLAVLYSADLE